MWRELSGRQCLQRPPRAIWASQGSVWFHGPFCRQRRLQAPTGQHYVWERVAKVWHAGRAFAQRSPRE
eukprot:6396077-Lingulodinium_polyedra.AAC.1